mmetsp:Transcript_25276/g.49403  ORF Transcript_25276/g.49403 Transcript_25276/m.49403 type:complete len:91 (+) Transcript_25276:4006-4278(+)
MHRTYVRALEEEGARKKEGKGEEAVIQIKKESFVVSLPLLPSSAREKGGDKRAKVESLLTPWYLSLAFLLPLLGSHARTHACMCIRYVGA